MSRDPEMPHDGAPFRHTPVLDWNWQSKARIRVNQGGMWSSKTWSIMQALFLKAVELPGVIITVVGQDIPNLKVGAIRVAAHVLADEYTAEWMRRMFEDFNRQELAYHARNGSLIEFKSFDNEQDARSGKRDIAFFNEANGIPFAIYDAVQMRTELLTFIDYNPSAEFWVHTEIIRNPALVKGVDYDYFISDYRHNPYIPSQVKEQIESRQETNPDWFKVYGRGKTGAVEGLIFAEAQMVEAWPEGTERVNYGLDFGFNDPTVLVRSCESDGMLIFDELIYRSGMTNKDIAAEFERIGLDCSVTISADSGDPKSIQELRELGWNVQPAAKGPDSIMFGIKKIKSQPYGITRRSVNGWRERGSYVFKRDRISGQLTEDPVDSFNHFWDACRYANNEVGGCNFGSLT